MAARASVHGMSRYVIPDYIGALAWIACTSLIPVLVLDLTDPPHAAAYALAWSIGLALYGIPVAFGQSLVAHGAQEPARAGEHYRNAVRHMLRLVAPIAAAVVCFAPLALGVFGRWYAEQGTTTLRLLALSAVPNVVVCLVISRARVQRRMRTVVCTLLALCALVLAVTVLLVPRVGIAGAGVAWLVAQCAVAAALLATPPLRRALGGLPPLRRLLDSASPMRRVLSGVLPLRRCLARAAAMRPVRSRRGGVPGGVLRRTIRELAAGGWAIEASLPTVSDTAVLMVRRANQVGVLKVSTSGNGIATLHRECRVLEMLSRDERLGAWRDLLPAAIRVADPAGHADPDRGGWLLLRRLPGRDGRHLAATDPAGLTASALRAIDLLHQLDGIDVPVDERLLRRWVDEPAELVRHALPDAGRIDRRAVDRPAIDRLVEDLRDLLSGQHVTLGWVHGDFYPGNVLVGPDGTVCGIIDWAGARGGDLPALDVVHWLLTVPSRRGTAPLGRRVADRLGSDRCWTKAESQLLRCDSQTYGRALLLLGWLRHVAGNLAKSSRYASSPLWIRRNVVPVLQQVAR